MPKRQKITLIGAGSAMFTQGLVADLIRDGGPWQLALVDIDQEALTTAVGLSQRMIQAKEADIIIEYSTERADVLPSSDVVVTTIGVGGRRAWEADVMIPRKYGIFQPVGDTIMAGGISRAMRMIPALVDIANDIVRLCPQARFFNYANPMSCNCRAIHKATHAHVVGLCIGTEHVVQELAELIGAPRNEISALACGINHFTWVYDLRWQGKDAWPLVRTRLREEITKGEAGFPHVRNNPFAYSLFDSFDAYPAVNDRHVSEFFPERFPKGQYYGKTLGVDAINIDSVIRSGDTIYENMRAQARREAPLNERVFDRAAGEHSQLIEILRSIETDNRVNYFANLPNHGAVPNLPKDAVLELTCVATGRGLTALHAEDYPDILAAMQSRKIAGEEITVEAALSGSRKLFVEALLADGCIGDCRLAEKLVNELITEQKKYLPQFV